MHHRHYKSSFRRGIYSLALVCAIMAVGMAGMHRTEGMSYLEAFYFMSMIATAQGSAYTPVTPAGMIFASFMAFLSVGAVAASIGFIFGPLFGGLWHLGVMKVEEEIHSLKHKPKP